MKLRAIFQTYGFKCTIPSLADAQLMISRTRAAMMQPEKHQLDAKLAGVALAAFEDGPYARADGAGGAGVSFACICQRS